MRLFPCLSVAVLLTAIPAQQPSRLFEVPTEAAQFRSWRMSGAMNSDRTRRVIKELEWHGSLKSAAAAAQKQDRPIVLIQALGRLKGRC